MIAAITNDTQQPVPQRARHLLKLAWLLAFLLLAVTWAYVIEGLRQRQHLQQEQQQAQQAEWLRLASTAFDNRLKSLNKELQLFSDPHPGLARDASTLAPLTHGRLWHIDMQRIEQLHGSTQHLANDSAQLALQWLKTPHHSKELTLLPAPAIGKTAQSSDQLQMILPLCQQERCDGALTGFLRVSDLLDAEQTEDHPAYAVLDINGNIVASNGHSNLDERSVTHFAKTRLSQVPLQLAVRYHSNQLVRSFNLFTIGLISGALTLSCLVLLLVFRVSQVLHFVEASNTKLSHARQLLALTNNSLREKMRKLIEEQRDQQTLIETVQAGVIIVDAQDLSIITSNDAATRMIGLSRQALLQQTLPQLFSTPERAQELLEVLKEQQIVTNREAQLNNHNDKTYWSMTSMRYLKFKERNAIAISLIDITERIAHAQRLQDEKQATEHALSQLQATQHELYQRATLDDLTGLANRRHFLSFANKALERARLASEAVAVALIDLDHFKQINDDHGHAAGDIALQHFAKNLRAALPATAVAGRMGGEEFALLLPDTSLGEAHAIVDVLRGGIASQCFYADNSRLRLTFSAGVTALCHGEDHDLSSLLKLADKALYQAKDQGRNCVESIAP